MRAPPFGFVSLYDAVDVVGRELFGASWEHVIPLNPKADDRGAYEQVITAIAEACEAGAIDAAYPRNLGGVDKLDPQVWRMPHWRSYFVIGTVDLDLPRTVNFKPDPSGETVRCTREIFVRRDSLDRFIKTLEPTAEVDEKSLRRASDGQIRVEIHNVYREQSAPPNIKKLPKLVRPRLNARGLDASENHIARIGDEPEFKAERRPPGKTIASEKRD